MQFKYGNLELQKTRVFHPKFKHLARSPVRDRCGVSCNNCPYTALHSHRVTQTYTALHSLTQVLTQLPHTALHSLTQPHTAVHSRTQPLTPLRTQPYTVQPCTGLHRLTQADTALHNPKTYTALHSLTQPWGELSVSSFFEKELVICPPNITCDCRFLVVP